MTDPGVYLDKLYSSRALFKALFEEAESILPPLAPGDEKRWRLESIRSQRDLGKLLGVSPSTVAIDLRRLENFGWLQTRRNQRLLGVRQGSRLFLMADSAAEATTGVPGLISREVLGVAQALQDAKAEAVHRPGAARGTMREWNPDEA